MKFTQINNNTGNVNNTLPAVVYVLGRDDGMGEIVLGVFSDRDKAKNWAQEECKATFNLPDPKWDDGTTGLWHFITGNVSHSYIIHTAKIDGPCS